MLAFLRCSVKFRGLSLVLLVQPVMAHLFIHRDIPAQLKYLSILFIC